LVEVVPIKGPHGFVNIEEEFATAFWRHDRFEIVRFWIVIRLENTFVIAGGPYARNYLEGLDEQVPFQRPVHDLPNPICETQIRNINPARADSDVTIFPRISGVGRRGADLNPVFLSLFEPNSGAFADRVRPQKIVDVLCDAINCVRADFAR
jgi:hypothetical protein